MCKMQVSAALRHGIWATAIKFGELSVFLLKLSRIGVSLWCQCVHGASDDGMVDRCV